MRLPVRCVRCAVHLSPWLGPMHCYAFPIGSKVISVLFILCRLCHLISGVVLCPFRCDLPCSRAVTFLREKKISNLRPILRPILPKKLIYEPILMIYEIGIVV